MNSNKTIEQLIVDFAEQYDATETTVKKYTDVVRYFFIWMRRNNHNPRKPERKHFISYKKEMIVKYSPYTVDCYLAGIRLFFQYLENVGVYENYSAGIRNARKTLMYKKKALTVTQTNALLNSLPRTTVKEKRNYAIINTMLRTGMRSIELHRANIGDIETTSTGYIMKVQRKGHTSKDRAISFDDTVMEPLQDYLLHRTINDSEPLLLGYRNRLTTRTIRGIVKQALTQQGLNSGVYTCHSLRHTFATLSIEAGCHIDYIRLNLGHSDEKTTRRYLTIVEERKQQSNIALQYFNAALNNTQINANNKHNDAT